MEKEKSKTMTNQKRLYDFEQLLTAHHTEIKKMDARLRKFENTLDYLAVCENEKVDKTDPNELTWVIAVDFKFDKLENWCYTISDKDGYKQLYNEYRTQILNTFNNVVSKYGFRHRMQNSLFFNNSADATKALKAVTLGLKNSWVKYFIDTIHLFKITPNSNAVDLLEVDLS